MCFECLWLCWVVLIVKFIFVEFEILCVCVCEMEDLLVIVKEVEEEW